MIAPLQSTPANQTTAVALPVGSRIAFVAGEADGKPTYDFLVTETIWTASGSSLLEFKFAGTKNGQRRNLSKMFPRQVTIAAAPTALGHYELVVIPGTGVSLQIYYWSGLVGN